MTVEGSLNIWTDEHDDLADVGLGPEEGLGLVDLRQRERPRYRRLDNVWMKHLVYEFGVIVKSYERTRVADDMEELGKDFRLHACGAEELQVLVDEVPEVEGHRRPSDGTGGGVAAASAQHLRGMLHLLTARWKKFIEP